MNVVPFKPEVTAAQLKHYADAICFSQVGLDSAEIAKRLEIDEHLIHAWLENWRELDRTVMGFHP